MTTDAYQPCPCGIDKKIKFCCGAEVLGDLGKVEDALSGEQRLGGETTGIVYEDERGHWHKEIADGGDRPETQVEE